MQSAIMKFKRLLSILSRWFELLNKSQSNDVRSCDSMSDISKTEDKSHDDFSKAEINIPDTRAIGGYSEAISYESMSTTSKTEDKSYKDSSILIIKVTDICAREQHPEDILSNLCGNDFCFEDVQCGCIESFLQSLKFQDEKLQRKLCNIKAEELDRYSIPDWSDTQPLWWKGRPINCLSPEYIDFISKVYMEMFLWCHRFRDALMATEGKRLVYNSGDTDPSKKVLTDEEFCKVLTKLREAEKDDYKRYIYPRRWPNSYGVEEDYDMYDTHIIRRPKNCQ